MARDNPVTVLFLINDLRIGGAERQLVELAKHLDKERFRVLVATLYSGGPLEKELGGEEGMHILHLGRRHRFDFAPLPHLISLLRREGVDIIQPFLTPATLFGFAAALVARTPVKIMTERCGVRLNTHPGNRLYRFVEDRLARFADVVVPNSDSGREYLLARGISASKVRVIYNGVAPSRIESSPEERASVLTGLGILPGRPVVGVVASLSPAKDHETLLQAAALVVRSLPEARFVIVGDGPLRPALEERARQLSLDSQVSFVGHRLRVAPYIGGFDVAVLPSCDHEGCSNFLLEAMALGRPLVATNIGGNRELFQPGEPGVLVPPREAEAMAQAILTILRSPQRAAQMGRQGRHIFESRFTLGTMIEAYEELYLGLWEQKKGRRATELSPAIAIGNEER